ncbi:Allene oxide synthase-lipoxygenase protein [Geodia barretti]|uniref:Allene oxide synthase-lipoxygenase protein n=1 Tax=Geodia barretti TaxID=519541 RepID=A0AA35WEP3_GEOBA|nr:Allene oxide synthase-lipoxygenase protein [Geodia barretti]
MSSHSQFHEISSHYLTCHAVMETYSMGLMRNIPNAHPVYKLLRPHVRYTMAINRKARESLINATGILARTFSVGADGELEVFKRCGTAYSVHWSNIKHNTEERGVDDASKLPHYYYRDDGYRVWDAIESYVTEIIDMFYVNDASVSEDEELQSFANDVHFNGFPAYGGSLGHEFPSSIATKAELVQICTLVMFTGSAQHAAVNFGQYTYYSFVPNAPFVLHKPPPTRKGKLKFKDLMDSLPDKEETLATNVLVSLLSGYSPDEIYLGAYPPEQFVEERAKQAVKELDVKLKQIYEMIKKRNEGLDVPYIYMSPKNIPNSITI